MMKYVMMQQEEEEEDNSRRRRRTGPVVTLAHSYDQGNHNNKEFGEAASSSTPNEVSFRLSCDDDALYARFDVKGEKNIKGCVKEDGGEVWTDSCVELFVGDKVVQPEQANEGGSDVEDEGHRRDRKRSGYVHFELSRSGALLCGEASPASSRLSHGGTKSLSTEECESVKRRTGGDDVGSDGDWFGELEVPWTVLRKRLRPATLGKEEGALNDLRFNVYCLKDIPQGAFYMSAYRIPGPYEGPFFHQPEGFVALVAL